MLAAQQDACRSAYSQLCRIDAPPGPQQTSRVLDLPPSPVGQTSPSGSMHLGGILDVLTRRYECLGLVAIREWAGPAEPLELRRN